MKTIRSRRANYTLIVPLTTGPYRVQFIDHKATVKDEVADVVLGWGGFYTLASNEEIKPDSRVLIIRDAGLGDVLTVTPLIRVLAKRGAIVDLMTDDGYRCLYEGNPYVRRVLSMQKDKYSRDSYDHVADLCKTVENAEIQGVYEHRITAFGHVIDVQIPPEERYLDYYLTDDERELGRLGAEELSARAGVRGIVGFGWSASWEQRNLAEPRRRAILAGLVEAGYGVQVFHGGRIDMPDTPAIENYTGRCSIRQTAAYMSGCDVVFMPDTGLFHIAGAIGIPTVAHFGPMPIEERQAHKKLEVVNTPGNCARFPCHSYSCLNHVDDGTVACMEVTPGQVIAAVAKFMPKRSQRQTLRPFTQFTPPAKKKRAAAA